MGVYTVFQAALSCNAAGPAFGLKLKLLLLLLLAPPCPHVFSLPPITATMSVSVLLVGWPKGRCCSASMKVRRHQWRHSGQGRRGAQGAQHWHAANSWLMTVGRGSRLIRVYAGAGLPP